MYDQLSLEHFILIFNMFSIRFLYVISIELDGQCTNNFSRSLKLAEGTPPYTETLARMLAMHYTQPKAFGDDMVVLNQVKK